MHHIDIRQLAIFRMGSLVSILAWFQMAGAVAMDCISVAAPDIWERRVANRFAEKQQTAYRGPASRTWPATKADAERCSAPAGEGRLP